MTPRFQITANGADLTAAIAARLLRLHITDATGAQADQLQIDLDDRDATIVLPAFGATLEVSLGFAETGLAAMGRWIVDEMEVEGPERLMTIRARSANTAAPGGSGNSHLIPQLKAMRDDETYEGLTIAGIVAKIAARNNLGTAVDPVIGAIAIGHAAQYRLSDSSFLSNLLDRYNAGVKVQGNKIIVFVHGSGVAPASGKRMEAIAVAPADCLRWHAVLTRRSSHKKAKASYHDPSTGQMASIVVATPDATDEDSETTDPYEYPDPPQAQAAATALVQRLDRGSEMLTLTLVGNPKIGAQSALLLSGFRPEVDKAWIVVRAVHVLDEGGYSTEVEAQKSLDQAAGYRVPKGLTAQRPGK